MTYHHFLNRVFNSKRRDQLFYSRKSVEVRYHMYTIFDCRPRALNADSTVGVA